MASAPRFRICTKQEEGKMKTQPERPTPTHRTFALALHSRASAQSKHSLHSPRHLVVTAETMLAAIRQPRSRWPPQRSSSSPHRPLRAAGCGNASPHYLRPSYMIPWHDLGSSPRRAACPAGLLPPLHDRRLFAGAQQLPALRSAAPLCLPAACDGVLLMVLFTSHTDSPACSSCSCDIGTEGASHKCQNQEWPFAGV